MRGPNAPRRDVVTGAPTLPFTLLTQKTLTDSPAPSKMAPRKRAASPTPSDASDTAPIERYQFPSVLPGPLTDSYTFHSVDEERVGGPAKRFKLAEAEEGEGETRKEEQDGGEEVHEQKVEGEWMLGVDEAGRGPALGALTTFLPLFSCCPRITFILLSFTSISYVHRSTSIWYRILQAGVF